MESKKSIKLLKERKIIPVGGGLLRLGETIPIDKFIVQESKKKYPKVLFIPTASKDLPAYSMAFRRVYKKLGCQVKILQLFNEKKLTKTTLEKLIISSDIIYVGGGDYDILLSMWKKYKVIPFIRLAYQQGTILAGLSAGCAIWYEYLINIDQNKKPHLKKGIGILKGAVIPHYKDDSLFLSEIHGKKISITAIEDLCAVIYINEKLCGSISANSGKAFTIYPPYAKKKQVNLYFHK